MFLILRKKKIGEKEKDNRKNGNGTSGKRHAMMVCCMLPEKAKQFPLNIPNQLIVANADLPATLSYLTKIEATFARNIIAFKIII
jgi:hypothetical protein